MDRINLRILFWAVFATYMIWGGFLMGACWNPVADECIGTMWWLFFTGLPSTLLTVGVTGAGIPEVAFMAIFGATQWAGLAVLIVWLVGRRKKLQKEDQ
jgi:hypothetical protein